MQQYWNPNIDGGPDRFEPLDDDLIRDTATGLVWPRRTDSPVDALAFPLSWTEALRAVAAMNDDAALGRTDWRLPNRRELLSLVDFGQARPAAPPGHPFQGLRQNWHWTSTTAAMAPRYAWYVHFAGGRMFYGRKDQYCLVLPVAGESAVLPRTGQGGCFDAQGDDAPCPGSGQDGDLRQGVPWPEPRFQAQGDSVLDRLTGLVWSASIDLAGGLVTWREAVALAASLTLDGRSWRLPTIRELESLVDASRHTPALPPGHPFRNVGQDGAGHPVEACWSATDSPFEDGWAFCLYLRKGAVGVGWKPGSEFSVWVVSNEKIQSYA